MGVSLKRWSAPAVDSAVESTARVGREALLLLSPPSGSQRQCPYQGLSLIAPCRQGQISSPRKLGEPHFAPKNRFDHIELSVVDPQS